MAQETAQSVVLIVHNAAKISRLKIQYALSVPLAGHLLVVLIARNSATYISISRQVDAKIAMVYRFVQTIQHREYALSVHKVTYQ